MSSIRILFGAVFVMAAVTSGCSCEPLVSPPDGGTGGGTAGGSTAGGMTAGGMAGGGSAGGMTAGGMAGGGTAGGDAGGMAGGGSAGGMAGGSAGGMAGGSAGGMAGGSAGGMAGGGSATQFTQFARDLINSDTTASALPRASSQFLTLPDDMPITFPTTFFDGGL